MSEATQLAADDRGVILPCPDCHRGNRIPFAQLHGSARCGVCKASLQPPALPVAIESPAVFSALLRTASLPVLIDFWAPWCGPCKMAAPEVDRLAALVSGKMLVAKVNTEAQPEIANSANIRSLPTFAVFAAGHELSRTLGVMSAPQLRAFALRAIAHPGTGQ